VLTSFTLILPS